jgi:hypothetical protein
VQLPHPVSGTGLTNIARVADKIVHQIVLRLEGGNA